jgi:FkbM family methyltransferase
MVVEYDQGLINVDTSSKIEYRILFHGYHEHEVIRLIKKVVKPGSVCLDIGANIGSHALVMAFAAGPGGRVIAVEPHPVVAKRLLKNVQLNGLLNVSVVRAALSDSDGTARFYVPEEDRPNQGISGFTATESATREIQVPTLSGPTFVDRYELTSCDFIKIDVEGYEAVVLEQLSDLIETHHPHMIFEYRENHWVRCGKSIEDALGLLSRWDYSIYYFREDVIRPLEKDVPPVCDIFCVPPVPAWDEPGANERG